MSFQFFTGLSSDDRWKDKSETHRQRHINGLYFDNNSYRKSSIIIGKKLIINIKEITGQSDSRESRQSIYWLSEIYLPPLCFHRRRRIYETAVKRKWSAADIRDAPRRYHTRSTSFRFFDDISFFASCLHTHTHTDTRAPLYRSVGYPTTKSYQEKDFKKWKVSRQKIQYRCALSDIPEIGCWFQQQQLNI